MHKYVILIMVILLCTGCVRQSNPITKEMTFTGKSLSWRARFVEKSSVTWTREPNGRYKFTSYHTTRPTLQYIGSNPSAVKDLTYRYRWGLSGGSGEVALGKDGYAGPLGMFYSNGAGFDEDSIIKMTVEWNGKQEQFVLKLSDKKQWGQPVRI
ncbi:MAG TPA: hypothetical protein VHS59_04585 [Bacillota bacterium]|nr:hypothetical protein [Bacillota bacterium]